MNKLVSDELIEDDNNLDQPNPQPLFERFNVIIDKGQEPMRLDKFLQNRIQGATRSKVQNSIENGLVKVNKRKSKCNYLIKPNDHIIVWSEGEINPDEVVPENIPIDVMFEDDYLIVINKPAGMVVHPGCGNYKGTLLNAVAYYWSQKQNDLNQLPRLGMVHRIDKNTSGILVLAKTFPSIYGMIQQFADHTIHRKYIALVWGDMEADSGTVRAHIGRHQRYRKKFDAYPNGEVGKEAVTHYKVLERFQYVTLIECQLETGRTHQIRVHMKHIGHTLFSDSEYGGDKILKGTVYKRYQQFIQQCFEVMPRHALHALELGFVHPITQENLFFSSTLPPDFQQVITLWRQYTQEKHTDID